VTRELLRSGTQRRGDAFVIGFLGSTLRESDRGGGMVVRFGISGAEGRTAVELAPGESAPLPGGGAVRLLEIFVSPDGLDSAAAIEVEDGRA